MKPLSKVRITFELAPRKAKDVTITIERGSEQEPLAATIRVTRAEAVVLATLDSGQGSVVSPAIFADAMYANYFSGDKHSNVVQVLIGRLRKKLIAARLPVEILSIRGLGYQMGTRS